MSRPSTRSPAGATNGPKPFSNDDLAPFQEAVPQDSSCCSIACGIISIIALLVGLPTALLVGGQGLRSSGFLALPKQIETKVTLPQQQADPIQPGSPTTPSPHFLSNANPERPPSSPAKSEEPPLSPTKPEKPPLSPNKPEGPPSSPTKSEKPSSSPVKPDATADAPVLPLVEQALLAWRKDRRSSEPAANLDDQATALEAVWTSSFLPFLRATEPDRSSSARLWPLPPTDSWPRCAQISSTLVNHKTATTVSATELESAMRAFTTCGVPMSARFEVWLLSMWGPEAASAKELENAKTALSTGPSAADLKKFKDDLNSIGQDIDRLPFPEAAVPHEEARVKLQETVKTVLTLYVGAGKDYLQGMHNVAGAVALTAWKSSSTLLAVPIDDPAFADRVFLVFWGLMHGKGKHLEKITANGEPGLHPGADGLRLLTPWGELAPRAPDGQMTLLSEETAVFLVGEINQLLLPLLPLPAALVLWDQVILGNHGDSGELGPLPGFHQALLGLVARFVHVLDTKRQLKGPLESGDQEARGSICEYNQQPIPDDIEMQKMQQMQLLIGIAHAEHTRMWPASAEYLETEDVARLLVERHMLVPISA